MFYIKLALGVFWFLFCSLMALLVSLIRWRHPSNGYFFVRLFAPVIHRLLGMKVIIRNPERLRAFQPCVFIGNHQSNFDILTHALCYPPRTVAIGKKELIRIPVFGLLFLASGNIMIDRKNREKALKELKEAEQDLTRKQISVYMFPEGTRSHGVNKMLPFKKGAFHMAINAKVPLVPVVASSAAPILDMKQKQFHPGTVFIDVLEPIPTQGLTLNDVDQTIQLAQERMQKALDGITTQLD